MKGAEECGNLRNCTFLSPRHLGGILLLLPGKERSLLCSGSQWRPGHRQLVQGERGTRPTSGYLYRSPRLPTWHLNLYVLTPTTSLKTKEVIPVKHTGLCQPPAHMRNAVICVTEQKRPNPNRYRGTGEGTAGGGGGWPKDASMTMFRLPGSGWARGKRGPDPCLYQESPWSRVRASPAESRVCPRLLRKRRLRKRAQGPGASHNCPQSRPAGKHLLSCPSHLSNLIFDITPCLPGDARPLHPRSRPVPWWSSG